MALNAGIILQGQQPNLLAARADGLALAQQHNDMRRQGQLNNLFQQDGAAIAQGDQGAINRLAGFDPMAALGVQGARQDMAAQDLSMQATRQGMRHADERLEMARQQARQQAAAQAAALSAAEREQEAESARRVVVALNAAQTPEQFDRMAAEFGAPQLAGRFADRQVLLAQAQGSLEGISQAQRFIVSGDAAAGYGLNPDSQYNVEITDEGVKASQIGGGGTNVTINNSPERPPEADPTSPTAMIATIDGILNDPDLIQGVGWRGAVNSALGTLAPNARRVEGRTNQLEGQAFLQAFESLKGGGQITEVEGQKATQAIGRLSTAVQIEDYKQALMELRDILALAQSRPAGWAATQSGNSSGPSDDELLQMYSGDR